MASINEFLRAVGHVIIETRDAASGELRSRREVDNLVVTLGKQFIAQRVAGNATPVISQIAVGTDGTPPVIADAALKAEIARANVDVAGGSVAGAVITLQASFPAGVATGALQEAGMFNGAGVLTNRVAFGVITKGAGDNTTITWTITIQ